MDRSSIVAAVAAELDERAGECREAHAAIGAGVADRLGLEQVVHRDPKPENPLDALGVGVFVRRLEDYPIEILARFGWAAVAVIAGGRGSLNRDRGWWSDARAAGVKLVAMDWMPSPEHVGTGEEAAIAWAAEHGAILWLGDYEGAYLHAPASVVASAVATTRRRCTAHGLGAGLTSLSTLPHSRVCQLLVEGLPDLSVPQPYDRWGAYEPDYAARAVDRYQALGAQRIAVGRGAFVDPDGTGPDRARWRSPQEIERHRATTPPGLATIWWPPIGRPSPRVLDAIVRP